MSRIENTTKNFAWSMVSSILSAVLGFISRTVFINILGMTYLGVNGLFTNILSMLSLTELGVGTAITFSLYKPLADNDVEKIKSLMHFYKGAYQTIALVVTCLGLAVLPFLGVIVKGGGGIEHIPLIYLIFLFNTAYSYLFTYKRTLLSADQKSYLITNINMVISIATITIQLVVLMVFHNYFWYLISASIIGVAQNFYVNHYIDKRYPYLLEKNYKKLSNEEKQPIVKNVKAMMLHKLGDLCINQTDNVIISSFINVTVVGLVSNYTLIINGVNSFIKNIFDAASASWGHLIATENEEKRLEVFKGYNFLAFWFFGWATVCFYILINPFITLWIGSERIISQPILNLILINYYLVGMRVPVYSVKSSAGIYVQDKFVPLIQSAINLIVSIIGVQYLGLAGVFIGTIVSSLVPCLYRPIVVYKYVFGASPKEYFINYFYYFMVVLLNILVVSSISTWVFKNGVTWLSLLETGLTCVILPNTINWLLFKNTEDYRYVRGIVKSIIGKALKK
jgi:O-antigen/teichoic acid export membrane protein